MRHHAGDLSDLLRVCAATITNTRIDVPRFGFIPDNVWGDKEAFYEQLLAEVVKADRTKVIRLADPILFQKFTNGWLHIGAGKKAALPTNPSERLCEPRPRVALFCIRSKNRPLCHQVRSVNKEQFMTRLAQRDHNAFLEQIELRAKDDLEDVLAKLRFRLYSKSDLLANTEAQRHCRELITGINQNLDIQQILRICKIVGISLEEVFRDC